LFAARYSLLITHYSLLSLASVIAARSAAIASTARSRLSGGTPGTRATRSSDVKAGARSRREPGTVSALAIGDQGCATRCTKGDTQDLAGGDVEAEARCVAVGIGHGGAFDRQRRRAVTAKTALEQLADRQPRRDAAAGPATGRGHFNSTASGIFRAGRRGR